MGHELHRVVERGGVGLVKVGVGLWSGVGHEIYRVGGKWWG